MSTQDLKKDIERRGKKHRESFSNYENAVGLICSLEAWFEYKWGTKGESHPGLLECFNRFPHVDGLTPDFEARFHTPYVIWGDHKRTIQPADRDRDGDVRQLIKYAAHCSTTMPSLTNGKPQPPSASPKCDVLVLVNSENDETAAEAIDAARRDYLRANDPSDAHSAKLAPIIVLGCHLGRESIEGEWYIVTWRNLQERNHRFSVPNITTDPNIPDLNNALVDTPYQSIPVNKPSLDLRTCMETHFIPVPNDEASDRSC